MTTFMDTMAGFSTAEITEWIDTFRLLSPGKQRNVDILHIEA